MVPFALAQQMLKVKLDIIDIEREVHGTELDAAERLLWRHWMGAENQRAARKSRVWATCCGRLRFRYQLEPDEAGKLWCMDCWSLPYACNAIGSCHAEPVCRGTAVAPNPNEPSDYPWRRKESDAIAPPPKRKCVPLRGVVEQSSIDGCCHLVSAEQCEEKVLLYSKDVLGVPAVGDIIEA